MVRSEAQLSSLADSFHGAALGATSWENALLGLARATGSRSIQLTGIGPQAAVLFNIRTDVDPACAQSFANFTPANLRLGNAGLDPFYQEVALPCEAPWLCTETNRGMFLALAAIRSRFDGHITDEQREIFTAAALHVRLAWRTQIALQQDRIKHLTALLEALSIAAFVCDPTGRVGTLTHAARGLVTAGRGLQLIDGQIRASRPDDAVALTNALGAVAELGGDQVSGCPLLQTLVIRNESIPMVIDAFALPHSYSFGLTALAPGVLLVARGGAGGDRRRATILQALYGLTGAETEIALRLAEGKTAEVIASDRGVAVGTVRAQIKTVLAKTGMKRQIELAARLSQL